MQGWTWMGMCIKKRTHHARPVASRRARGARRSAQAKVSTSTSRILARHPPSSLLPSPNQLRRDRSPFPTSTIRAVPSRRPFHKLGHELSFLLPPFSQALSLRHTTQRSAVCPPRSLVVAQLGALVPKPSIPEPRTMAGARKRAFSKAEPENAPSAKPPSLLQQIRNTWQFANLFQFIMLFGKALKMDDNFDIEDLEADCLKPGAPVLQDIGLGFLKYISSHRGLTYVSVSLRPFNTPLTPSNTATRFLTSIPGGNFWPKLPKRICLEPPRQPPDSPILTSLARCVRLEEHSRISAADIVPPQLRVLHGMTQIILMNPERLRERTEEQKDTDQTSWVCLQSHL